MPYLPDDETFSVSDERDAGFFIVDDEVLDEHAKHIGLVGLGVYNVLLRHMNRPRASCFPSYQTIADLLGVSRTTAIKGVAILVERGLIRKQARTDKAGDATSNNYAILPVKKRERLKPGGGTESTPRSTESTLRVVQNLHHGGTDSVPEPELLNQTKSNHTHTARSAPLPRSSANAAGECVSIAKSRFKLEQVRAWTDAQKASGANINPYAVARARWLDGTADDDVEKFLAASTPEAVVAQRAAPADNRTGRYAAAAAIQSIVNSHPAADTAAEIARLNVSDDTRAWLLKRTWTPESMKPKRSSGLIEAPMAL